MRAPACAWLCMHMCARRVCVHARAHGRVVRAVCTRVPECACTHTWVCTGVRAGPHAPYLRWRERFSRALLPSEQDPNTQIRAKKALTTLGQAGSTRLQTRGCAWLTSCVLISKLLSVMTILLLNNLKCGLGCVPPAQGLAAALPASQSPSPSLGGQLSVPWSLRVPAVFSACPRA